MSYVSPPSLCFPPFPLIESFSNSQDKTRIFTLPSNRYKEYFWVLVHSLLITHITPHSQRHIHHTYTHTHSYAHKHKISIKKLLNKNKHLGIMEKQQHGIKHTKNSGIKTTTMTTTTTVSHTHTLLCTHIKQ